MIEQNKNTSVIWGRIASGLAACILLFSLVVVPLVFADPVAVEIVNLGNVSSVYNSSTSFGLTPDDRVFVSSSDVPVYGVPAVIGDYYGILIASSSDSSSGTRYIGSGSRTSGFVTNTYSSDFDIYYSTSGWSRGSYSSGSWVTSLEEGLSLLASAISGSSSSGTAQIIPYYGSSDLLIGTNSNVASVYLRSYFPNNAAVAILNDSGSYVPVVVGLEAYGVSSVINGVETPLTRYDLVIDGTTYYGYSAPSLASPFSSFETFTSDTAATQACIDLLQSSVPVAGEKNVTYWMPGGNIAYAKISERTSLVLLQVNFDVPLSSSKFSSLNIRYGWADSLPSGSLPSSDSLTPVPWVGTGNKNVLGQFSAVQATLDFSSHVGDYLIIYNPFMSDYQGGIVPDGASQTTVNPNVLINVDAVTQMKIYGLTQTLNPSTGVFSESPSGKEYDLDVNSTHNIFTDQDGNVVSPEQGGGGNTVSVTNFWNWLGSQFESLKSLFATGHDTIQTLVGYGSDFMTAIMGLYSWLPPAVFSVLQASLILVIIVGVVKVFL